MIVFLRKNEGVLTVVSIVLLALISIYFGMVSHQEMALFHSAPFLTALMGAKGPMLPSWLNYLMFYPLAIVNAFLLNRIIQQEGLVTKLSNIPILIFVILLLCLPEAFRSPLAMVATTVVIIVLSYSLKVLNEVHTDRALFNASFLSGGLILVQPLYFPMFFSLIILLLLTGVVSVKRLLLAALGLLTPIYLVFGLVFLFNPTEVQAFNDLLVVSDSLMNISPTQISFLTLMLVSILFGNALTASTKDQEVSKESTNCKTVKVTKKLPWSLVIDGTNTQASLRGTEDLGSLDYNIFQSTYGVEYALSNQFSIGGVFGYGQNNLYNYEFADTRVNSDTYSGGLYGLYKPSEPATIALLGGYSRFNSDSRRPIQFGTINRLAEADWNSNGYTVALTGEYAFTLSKVTESADPKQKEKERRNAILLKPNALVSFAGYSQGLIEESGAQSLNLKLNPHTATSVIFGGGLILQAPIVVSSESRLIPRLGVGYRYDVNGNSDEEHEVTGGFVDLPEAGEIDVYGQNRGSNDVDVSLGLEYEISSSTAIYSNVAGSFWSNGNELTYGGGFRYSW